MVTSTPSPLLDLFRSQGHEFIREGKSYKTRCPFHDDHTPSLSVEPERGLWRCFGCGQGGDGISFLQKSLDLTFGEAADKWREFSGEEPKHRAPRPQFPAPIDPQPSAKPNSPSLKGLLRASAGQPSARLTAEDLATFERLQELYAQEFAVSDQARAYLESRGITDAETLRAFGLGYVSGRGLPALTPDQRTRLQELGILNAKGRETLFGCIVCPLTNRDGRVVSFWGRRIVPGSNPHRALLQNSESPRAMIHRQAARGSRQVVVVEGFLDALACYQAGVRNVCTATGETEFARVLHKEGVQEVLLALDPDEAGDRRAQRLAEALQDRGIGSARVRLSADPADYFQNGGTAAAFRAAPTESLGERSDEAEYILDSHGLLYRVRALNGKQGEEKLKVHILVTVGDQSHRDTLNLYTHKARRTFANAVASRFGRVSNLTAAGVEEDLETVIQGLEERRRRQTEPAVLEEEKVILSPRERDEALSYLSAPDLVGRLQADMEALGYVGEEEAKLLVYLIATSRKLSRPLSGIIGSGAGAGKSFLAELAEKLTPPEEVILFSKLSPQALYYLPEDYLRGKLLILEERAGGEGADYAIRTLQSKDCLTQIVTLKDTETGQMAAKRFTVRGPIAYLETTTQSYLNQENTSRCFETPLDESAEQTRKIHEHQRRARSLAGLRRVIAKDAVTLRHHNAQRLLEPVSVVIPYAEQLEFPDRYLRTRRDHERFLSLIEAVAFLHQYQRPSKQLVDGGPDGKEVRYIEATVEDYAIAYKLALRVLWVSLDELSRWGRELVDSCRHQVEEAQQFNPDLKVVDVAWTRRQLRESLGWPDKRLRACLDELVSLEYFQVVGGSKGKTFHYTLNPDFSHNPKALGLLTPDQLRAKLQT